jgi:NADH dehydrogenase
VAALGRRRFAGFFAWVLWIVVHIAWLIGFRNRFVVLFEWAWAYFTYERSGRVILDRPGGPGKPMARGVSSPAAAGVGSIPRRETAATGQGES